MCTEGNAFTRRILDPEKLRKAILDSPDIPSNLSGFYVTLQSHLTEVAKSYPDLRTRSICKVSISPDFCFLAEVEEGTRGSYAVFFDAIVPLQLQMIFERLLSHPEVLPGIGQPPNCFEYPSLKLLFKPPVTVVKGVDERPQINDETRCNAVTFLVIAACQFLLLHEFGHVVGQHFSLFRNRLRLPRNIRGE